MQSKSLAVSRARAPESAPAPNKMEMALNNALSFDEITK